MTDTVHFGTEGKLPENTAIFVCQFIEGIGIDDIDGGFRQDGSGIVGCLVSRGEGMSPNGAAPCGIRRCYSRYHIGCVLSLLSTEG